MFFSCTDNTCMFFLLSVLVSSSHNITFDHGCFVVDTGRFVAELLYNVNLKNTRHNNMK